VISPEQEAQLAARFPEAWCDLIEAMARLAMSAGCQLDENEKLPGVQSGSLSGCVPASQHHDRS